MTTKTKTIIREICILILGISIGTTLGFKFISPFNSWTTWMWTGNGIGAYAEVQYYKANYPSALKAQNEYLSYLAGIEKKKSEWNTWSVPWMTEQILNYERTVTYARMAILEKREGKSAEAEKCWENAVKSAVAVGWKNSNRDYLLGVVNAMDTKYHQMGVIAEPGVTAVKQQTP